MKKFEGLSYKYEILKDEPFDVNTILNMRFANPFEDLFLSYVDEKIGKNDILLVYWNLLKKQLSKDEQDILSKCEFKIEESFFMDLNNEHIYKALEYFQNYELKKSFYEYLCKTSKLVCDNIIKLFEKLVVKYKDDENTLMKEYMSELVKNEDLKSVLSKMFLNEKNIAEMIEKSESDVLIEYFKIENNRTTFENSYEVNKKKVINEHYKDYYSEINKKNDNIINVICENITSSNDKFTLYISIGTGTNMVNIIPYFLIDRTLNKKKVKIIAIEPVFTDIESLLSKNNELLKKIENVNLIEIIFIKGYINGIDNDQSLSYFVDTIHEKVKDKLYDDKLFLYYGLQGPGYIKNKSFLESLSKNIKYLYVMGSDAKIHNGITFHYKNNPTSNDYYKFMFGSLGDNYEQLLDFPVERKFYDKYLKYKMKYLKIKETMGF